MMFAAIGQPKDEAISRSLFHGFCEHLPTGRKETWPMNKFIGFPVSIAPPLLTRMKWGCDRRDYRLMGDVLNCNLPRHLWSSQWEADRDSFIVHKCDAQPFYFADLRRSQGQIIVCDDLQALCNVLCDIQSYRCRWITCGFSGCGRPVASRSLNLRSSARTVLHPRCSSPTFRLLKGSDKQQNRIFSPFSLDFLFSFC